MGWDELMETLKKRLEEQKERHEGGNKWIGTGGTSPFGHGGYNPQGVRIGGAGKNKSAVKVWEQRAYRDYDDTQELGTRNIKVALRRQCARPAGCSRRGQTGWCRPCQSICCRPRGVLSALPGAFSASPSARPSPSSRWRLSARA